MNDEQNKPVRGSRSKPSTTLKVQPKTSCAHLITKISINPFYTDENGQKTMMLLAKSVEGSSKIYSQQKHVTEFFERGRGILAQAIEQYKGTALPKLYDMIADKLYECHFNEKRLLFRACELARLTDNKDNAKRVKKRFVEAAHILYEFNFTAVNNDKRIDFRLLEAIEETRGGFICHVTDHAMELFSKTSLAQHDTVLYRLKDQNECTYSLGRWIEDFSIRHSKTDKNSLKEVKFTAKAIMGCCPFIPKHLMNSREYSKRMPWLEAQLNALQDVNFIKWKWIDGRPASLKQEAVTHIQCVFVHERTPIGPATRFEPPP